VPFLIDVDEIIALTNDFLHLTEIPDSIIEFKRAIKLANSLLANTLISTCDNFRKFLQLKPKLKWKELQEQVTAIVFQEVE
jgi:hypothetical protein